MSFPTGDLTPPTAFTDHVAMAQMERLATDMRQVYRRHKAALAEVTQAQHDALVCLAVAAGHRDDDTGTHIVRMGIVAEALALALGEPPAWARLLRQAAPMHDIGKIGIPDAVLKKPGPLTPEERLVMNGHAAIGAQILGESRSPLFQLAAEIALAHHERWNGSGYPSALAGAAIPMAGRIVAVVDFFDALTMDRCYRPAFADEVALEMLRAERGRAFEPVIVDTFLEHAAALIALRDRLNAQPPAFSELFADGFDAAADSSLAELA